MALANFSLTFDPESDPPAGWHDETITVAGTEVSADLTFVTYEDGHDRSTITAEGTEIYLAFIHVDDVPP